MLKLERFSLLHFKQSLNTTFLKLGQICCQCVIVWEHQWKYRIYNAIQHRKWYLNWTLMTSTWLMVLWGLWTTCSKGSKKISYFFIYLSNRNLPSICSYRYKIISDPVLLELKHVLEVFADPLTKIYVVCNIHTWSYWHCYSPTYS